MKSWQPRHTRLLLLGLALLAGGIAIGLTLAGLSQKVTYFYSPTDVEAHRAELLAEKRNFRLGGLVETDSVKRTGLHMEFTVTDLKNSLRVTFEGVPPDLFRERQGVVAEGHLTETGFAAHTLLAKHDEKYMPPEVARALHDKGIKEMGTQEKGAP